MTGPVTIRADARALPLVAACVELPAVVRGDARQLPLPDASIDAVCTDPPYELGFMGKAWDRTGVAFDPATWAEALRVAKPGAFLLAFGGTRTHHRIACAIEDAGWIIEDSIGCLGWVHAQGFPKGKNKLKPAWEPIVLARKRGPCVLQVDACRVGWDTASLAKDIARRKTPRTDITGGRLIGSTPGGYVGAPESPAGRWPTNLVLVHHPDCADRCVAGCHVAELDGQSGVRSGGHFPDQRTPNAVYGGGKGTSLTQNGGARAMGDSGGASRFYPTFRFGEQDGPAPCCRLWGWRTESAPTAEPPSGTTPATADASAPSPARTSPSASDVQRVASAASLCDSHATAIARSAVATSAGADPGSTLGLGSITESERRILSLSLALCAEALASSDTTRTTADLSTSCGSVASIISTHITKGSDSRTRRSGQRPPLFRFEAKADTWERPTIVREGAGEGRVTGLGGKVRECNVCGSRAINSGATELTCGHSDHRWVDNPRPEVIAHATVKPVDLMRWLVRLVTPPGGLVLDPFAGSGATLQAAQLEGFRSVGVELDADHCALIAERLSWPVRIDRGGKFERIRPTAPLTGQLNMFSEVTT